MGKNKDKEEMVTITKSEYEHLKDCEMFVMVIKKTMFEGRSKICSCDDKD